MKAAELMVRCLENEGVDYIFGLPGEENTDLLDALLESSIRFITVRHEQGGAFMADVYGRLTGRAGVCLATLGPGATNLMTGVADANMDRAPLVAITGQAGLERMHKESHQYMDVVRIFETITKWNTQVRAPEIVPEVVRKAFKVAQTEKPGATHIELPEDVAAEETAGEPLLAQQPYPTEPLASQVRRAVEIISEAERPLVLAGNGVARADAAQALTEFANRLNLPVATTFMGKGAIPYTDPHSLLTVGLQARDYVACGLDRADCVITVGYDLVEYGPDRWNPDRDKKIVHIDMSPAEVDKHYIVGVGVLGDLSMTLQEIAERARPSQDTYAAELRQMILEELEAYRADRAFPIKPQRIIADLRAALGPEDIVISDVGAHKMWVARMYPCERPNTAIISNGFASMGIAIPGAVAAKLAFPERKVVAVVGDGGFLMNVQELETAVREELAFTVLIFTDGGYGLIGWKQELEFGRPAYVAFGNPDFVKLAESFGCAGYRVEGGGELPEILAEALALDRPAVIDCPVDYRENLRLTEKLGQLVCPI